MAPSTFPKGQVPVPVGFSPEQSRSQRQGQAREYFAWATATQHPLVSNPRWTSPENAPLLEVLRSADRQQAMTSLPQPQQDRARRMLRERETFQRHLTSGRGAGRQVSAEFSGIELDVFIEVAAAIVVSGEARLGSVNFHCIPQDHKFQLFRDLDQTLQWSRRTVDANARSATMAILQPEIEIMEARMKELDIRFAGLFEDERLIEEQIKALEQRAKALYELSKKLEEKEEEVKQRRRAVEAREMAAIEHEQAIRDDHVQNKQEEQRLAERLQRLYRDEEALRKELRRSKAHETQLRKTMEYAKGGMETLNRARMDRDEGNKSIQPEEQRLRDSKTRPDESKEALMAEDEAGAKSSAEDMERVRRFNGTQNVPTTLGERWGPFWPIPNPVWSPRRLVGFTRPSGSTAGSSGSDAGPSGTYVRPPRSNTEPSDTARNEQAENGETENEEAEMEEAC